jgi:hypothetical protein
MEEFVAVKPLWTSIIEYYRYYTSALGKWNKWAHDNKIDSQQFLAKDIELRSQIDTRIPNSKILSSLKQEALLFDKIYLLKDESIDFLADHVIRELDWLVEQNIISFVEWENILGPTPMPAGEFRKAILEIIPLALADLLEEKAKLLYKSSPRLRSKILKLNEKILDFYSKNEYDVSRKPPNELIKITDELFKTRNQLDNLILEADYPMFESAIRSYAVVLRYFRKAIAIPLLSYTSYLKKVPNSNKSNIAHIVIHNLPLPVADTPWEKIIEYRDNPDNQNNLLMLRRWMRKISDENLSLAEYKQELDWLMAEYQAHLKLHKIKANMETLETVIKVPLEILENLIKLKFSKLPDPLFAVKRRKISLMEAELNAPGREIAYLVKTKQSFG